MARTRCTTTSSSPRAQAPAGGAATLASPSGVTGSRSVAPRRWSHQLPLCAIPEIQSICERQGGRNELRFGLFKPCIRSGRCWRLTVLASSWRLVVHPCTGRRFNSLAGSTTDNPRHSPGPPLEHGCATMPWTNVQRKFKPIQRSPQGLSARMQATSVLN
jgi:hypothetical protein